MSRKRKTGRILTAWLAAYAGLGFGEAVHLTVTPTALVSREEPPRQRITVTVVCEQTYPTGFLHVQADTRPLLDHHPLGPLQPGTNTCTLALPEPSQSSATRWTITDASGRTLAATALLWQPPRHWTLYVVKSAHIDIGLHEPQYQQRLLTVQAIDDAKRLTDQTADWPDASRFRSVVEGLWWWGNYVKDRPASTVDETVDRYIKTGLFGIGASHSGNHTQTYGTEELCRSAAYAQHLRDRWGLAADTMLMVDNNGITWPLVTAYADAGIRYLGFFPNAWNPPTVGASRIDVGWDSSLPHLFYWLGPDHQSKLLVWSAPHYIDAARAFGFQTCTERSPVLTDPDVIAPVMATQLAKLEARYPYDLWLIPNYDDNERPNLVFPELAKAWNARWRWPELRTVGDLSEPFRRVEQRFGSEIPTLSGMITGGWAQHPPSAPTLFARKRETDRLLPTAETLSTLTALSIPSYAYPVDAFAHAWDALICNDEHGYGVSDYKGRSVYDTWMQKRDWIERAHTTAKLESARALAALTMQIPAATPSVLIFNSTLQPRTETATLERPGGQRLLFRAPEVPPLGYTVVPLAQGEPDVVSEQAVTEPPTLENAYYRVIFTADGTMASLYDKALSRELTDPDAPYRCNQFVCTRDAHHTFSSPANARFVIETSPLSRTVVSRMDDPVSGAAVEQRVTLPTDEKRIEIDNRLSHVRMLADTNRWCCFGYYAFPFAVSNAAFKIGLNGCMADPYADQTGLGTDTYHAVRDWAHVGNERFGITLVQLDSSLIEFGTIHKKKNTFGEQPIRAHLYSYLFNNGLYGHAYEPGPSHMNLRYRYTITSHAGTFSDSDTERFAERRTSPLLTALIAQPQKGALPPPPHSFLSADASHVRLLTLKPAEAPGHGVIARLQETDGAAAKDVSITIGWKNPSRLTRCSVTEQDREVLESPVLNLAPFGYATLRIETPGFSPRIPPETAAASDGPAQVGSVDTGLIDAPRASFGDTGDILYLQWGQNREPDLSHYDLYRGKTQDFVPCETTRIATIPPGPYSTSVIYEDHGLSPNTTYYYRVRAVNREGRAGEVSALCTGITREP